ncbi:MAG TPA: glycosyltransferase [Gammaproteobacteria bacterium]|nr:glycosyltransferase [Gammaproteobacteria bacterium]
MPQKIRFAQSVEADFIASQLPPAAGAWLYAECPKSKVLHAPAALNPLRFRPLGLPRDVDVGFRGDLYPLSIGDDERTRVLERFRTQGERWGLRVDIRYERVPGPRWNECLNRWHGIVGAESGTYFLERDDVTERKVKAHLSLHSQESFEEVRRLFFDTHPNPVSGKAISSRHFEPIGTRTAQLLLTGTYNDILRADEHYFAIARDLSDVETVVERYRDPAERARIVEAAWQLAMQGHTYDHRVAALVEAALA